MPSLPLLPQQNLPQQPFNLDGKTPMPTLPPTPTNILDKLEELEPVCIKTLKAAKRNISFLKAKRKKLLSSLRRIISFVKTPKEIEVHRANRELVGKTGENKVAQDIEKIEKASAENKSKFDNIVTNTKC